MVQSLKQMETVVESPHSNVQVHRLQLWGCSKFKAVGEDYEDQISILCSVRHCNEVEGIQC